MIRRQWLSSNLAIIIAALILCTLSVITLFAVMLNDLSGQAADFNPWQQVFAIGLGLVLMILTARLDTSIVRRQAFHIYAAVLLLLIGVLVWAEPIQGAKRWYELGSFQLQPAELMKLALIILLARLLSKRTQASPGNILAASALYVGVPVVLILLQPDLGTALIMVTIWFGVLTTTKLPRVVLASILAFGALVLVVATPFMAEYQQRRIDSFLNPLEDPTGAGYNAQQAMIAIGSGQLTGRGLDGGSQSQLNFLPSKHTDFIFSVIGEKLGFIGAGLVLVCLACLTMLIFLVASQASSLFGAYVAAGVGLLIAIQSAINIGMNLGLLPITGIPLPFVSYGGTHTVANFLALGLVLNIIHHRRRLDFHP